MCNPRCQFAEMSYNFDFISNELKRIIEPATAQSYVFEKALGYRLFENAYVAPYYSWDKSIGCIIDENRKAVKDSECVEWKECEAFYDLDCASIKHKRVIFLGFLLTVFGHSYTDDLRKLWFINTDECKSLIADGWELVYTTSWNRTLPDSVLEVFNLAGFDISSAIQVTDISRFDKVCIPDNSLVACDLGRKYCEEYKNAIDRIKLNVPTGGKRIEKVYFSRSKYSKGSQKEYGETAIERVFKRQGYSIVFPEDYSIIEQIQMVRNCTSFAATEGSVAHLSLFCRPGTNVTIINKANYLNYHQVMINKYADLNVTYVEAHHSSRVNLQCPWWGPFFLCVNRYLEHFVGHRIFHLPYWLLPSYWKYSRNMLYRCFNRMRKLICE